ncbi:MAG: hypothetical protein KAH38_13055 [Candidatus Hydrogenedentes bacterium]|nr:hypothetical protein [Candidatus Hydrogenedentota bacterium]
MISLLKIHCPHCGVAGQIMMPPPGSIIIGPCPECSRLVAIFASEALPLDDEIMNKGTIKEKYEHVMQVLSEYLERQVRQCFSEGKPESGRQKKSEEPDEALRPITEGEIQRFVQKELSELDSPDFFDDFD